MQLSQSKKSLLVSRSTSGPTVAPGAKTLRLPTRNDQRDPKAQTNATARSDDAARQVIAELEPEQLSAVRYNSHFGRQALRPATVAVLWLLRAYVVIMLIIVVVQVWTAIRG